jgi:hypothetical protein
MNEAEARELAVEIGRYPGWWAYAKEQPFLNRDNHDWWVQAHHVSMDRRATSANPYPVLPITSRDEWNEARGKWS